MHVGVFTYQTGHLKTLQLVLKLMTKPFRITVFAFPFKLRPGKSVVFADRPYQLIDFDMPEFCAKHGVEYRKVDGWEQHHADQLGLPGDHDAPDIFLTCIAKIIPSSFIEGRTILNCHPGLLPHNRGLDAFKWCIVNEWPIGITLHKIDEQIDRGTILRRLRVPVLPDDTLGDVCDRMYSMELDLMANFDYYMGNLAKCWLVADSHPLSRKLVPRDLDERMEEIFLQKRRIFMELASDYTGQDHISDQFYRNHERALDGK